jgi:fumarate hydratase class II
MKSTTYHYLTAAMAALVNLPFEFAYDFATAPESSQHHFARSIGNIATAASRAEMQLTDVHPERAELIRAAIFDCLQSSVLDERAFTVSCESTNTPSTRQAVRENLTKLEKILVAHANIVMRAAELVEIANEKEGVHP